MIDYEPFYLTVKLAGYTTVILFCFSAPFTFWLAFSRFRHKFVLEALINLPLVLPPVVLGYYLLVVMSPGSFFGRFLEATFHKRFVFSFEGLVIGSVIFSLPFMVNSLLTGFESVPGNLIEASLALGKSRLFTFFHVVLPKSKAAVITGTVLTFAHTLGEFGVVLMLGGSIPGKTRVASIAIFEAVESMNYDEANLYAFILFLISFFALIAIYRLNATFRKGKIAF